MTPRTHARREHVSDTVQHDNDDNDNDDNDKQTYVQYSGVANVAYNCIYTPPKWHALQAYLKRTGQQTFLTG